VVRAPARSFSRYVALGESSTEGLDDPYPGGGYRGWADRLAERLAELDSVGVRGRLAGQVRETQLAAALALQPDLASVVAGMNDLLRPRCDVAAVAGQLEAMLAALVAAGAIVLTCTLPDPVPVMPITRSLRPRLLALNAALREAAARHGAVLVDFGADRAASDPRLCSVDRLHANQAGHARIAARIAAALGLPERDEPAPAAALPVAPTAPARRPGRRAGLVEALSRTGSCAGCGAARRATAGCRSARSCCPSRARADPSSWRARRATAARGRPSVQRGPGSSRKSRSDGPPSWLGSGRAPGGVRSRLWLRALDLRRRRRAGLL
jgi:lysophospholipase L1-like esterase